MYILKNMAIFFTFMHVTKDKDYQALKKEEKKTLKYY